MSASALERQIRPIYDALDTGSNKSAIVSCNKILKKQPKNDLVKALKALALVRTQKVEESLLLCDEVLASKTTDDSTLSAMIHVLRGLGRHRDIVTLFEDAYKKQPQNEDLGAQTFFANVRIGNWKVAQQIATRLHKQFQEDRYLYWGITCTILQAHEPSTALDMRSILYKLAHRLLSSCQSPSYLTADRFYLHLMLLRELDLFDEAKALLESDVAKNTCATSLICDEVRREIWQRKGLLLEEGDEAQRKISEKNDRNWLEFLSVINSTFSYCASSDPSEVPDSSKKDCISHISKTRQFFVQIATKDGSKDRSASLGLLELENRARQHGVSEEADEMVNLMQQYFSHIGDKACCFEDLKPYLNLSPTELSRWHSFLQSTATSTTTISDLRRTINVQKLVRYNLTSPELTTELEKSRAEQCVKLYLEAAPLGKDLPGTELQPADDLALLAGQIYTNLWKATADESYLYNATTLLEFALTRSQHAFQMRLLLIRIYHLLAAPSMALEHYRQMNIRQIQNDSLSHFVLPRSSIFSLAATGDLTYVSECLESSQIYLTNSQETAEFIIQAFTNGKFSQIPDFIVFEDRLDNSLERDVVKIEHLRMRLTHEPLNTDLFDMELIELKFIFDRVHHDNRDFDILPNYQPHCLKSFNEQTYLFNKPPGQGWLSLFLKIYIRAFQHGSDLDETVEDRLLVGDRPKQSPLIDTKVSLDVRLAHRPEEELEELTADERLFVEYATALGDWLEPHHNYIRPSPATVLAEAAKLSEQKTGLPLRGADIPLPNGNNSAKKEEDAPPVTEAPALVTTYFEKMAARFKEVNRSSNLPVEALHVATLAQEGFLLLAIETLRFKPASIVKVHKLSGLVQSFKTIRTTATSVLLTMSAELLLRAETAGTSDARSSFTKACESMLSSSFDHDFTLDVAKMTMDSRKKVLEGVGKGIAKVCSTQV